jgi:hypothetical protein
MYVTIDPGSGISGEKIECDLSRHPDGNPKGLRSSVGFFYYPGEEIVDGDDGRSGNGADPCSGIIEVIQGCHIDGPAPHYPLFCNHTNQVDGAERDHKSCSLGIIQVNNFFSHIQITVQCVGEADNCRAQDPGYRQPAIPVWGYGPAIPDFEVIIPAMEIPI